MRKRHHMWTEDFKHSKTTHTHLHTNSPLPLNLSQRNFKIKKNYLN